MLLPQLPHQGVGKPLFLVGTGICYVVRVVSAPSISMNPRVFLSTKAIEIQTPFVEWKRVNAGNDKLC
jgi:hypothetical protein